MQRLKRTPPKKQQSILSFFSSSSVHPTPPRPSPSSLSLQPPHNSQLITPSTITSLDERNARPTPSPTGPASEPPFSRLTRSSASPPGKVRRELFSEHDAELSIPKPKRRRLLKLDDFSDDESTEPSPFQMEDVKTSETAAAADHSLRRVSPPSARTLPDEDEEMRTMRNTPHGMEVAKSQQKGCNFAALQCTFGDGNKATVPVQISAERRRKAREKLGALSEETKVGQEKGGWCERFPWSVDVRDAKMRRPNHPDYDRTTLHVPGYAFKGNGRGMKDGVLSPFQKQFWSIKMANYDVVIFFKKGKFYELYDIDADIGHQQLGLNFTKGGRVDMRCCGVPEQSFDKHCARLIDMGYKVGRVEQTETANAAEKRKSGGGANTASVCERSLVRILTKGTVTDDGLLRDYKARYVVALVEREETPHSSKSKGNVRIEDENQPLLDEKSRTFGVCFVDVASGSINIGEIDDDSRIAKMERLMMFLRPHEIIVDLSAVSQKLRDLVKWLGRTDDTDVVDMSRGRRYSEMTEKRLEEYLNRNTSAIAKSEYERVCTHLKHFPLSAKAFGAIASHLKSLIIDKETLSLGNYHLFPSRHLGGELSPDSSSGSVGIPLAKRSRLGMDAPTLQNLEVLSAANRKSDQGSLLSFVDRAHTPAGRRLVRKWLSEPLINATEIEDRLESIEDIHRLEDESGQRTFENIVRQLRTKKDLERALPKLHQQAIVDDAAVMFDDSNKRRVKDFVSVLHSLETSLKALEMFRTAAESILPRSKRLPWIYSIGMAVPKDATTKLQYFLGQAFDLETAEASGSILPNRGAVPHYDECKAALDNVEAGLDAELTKWKRRLGDPSLKYYHRGKEPFQLEISINALKADFPEEFELVSESKAAKRFYTRKIKQLVREQVAASEAYESASQSVARDMIRQFDQEYPTWAAVSTACAELDALIGLAAVSRADGTGEMCRPQILPDDHPEPVFQATELRHPILAAASSSFVSNDVALGGETDTEVMILTGPNAGGKSTMARQIALAVILAQLGCFVPAKSLRMRPFHDIFVRMGASDDLARGRSTFMVEMEEVGHILNHADSRSLIIADEVGRGTSTHDGYAVATAALNHIATVNKSLTVFSTHYSHLGQEVIATGEKGHCSRAELYEMSAIVDETSKQITFLYKLQPGSSGHSRGIYCARVAGIPEIVAANAEKASVSFDRRLLRKLANRRFCAVIESLNSNNLWVHH